MGPEPLAVLLLPCQLEGFQRAAHARTLLEISRVIAVEPRRARRRGRVSAFGAAGQARRLRFPGEPRLLVLYHPAQYPLARALGSRYKAAELWYLRVPDDAVGDEEAQLDQLAQERAVRVHNLAQAEDLVVAEEALRLRLRELEVISHRPFFPGGRISRPRLP